MAGARKVRDGIRFDLSTTEAAELDLWAKAEKLESRHGLVRRLLYEYGREWREKNAGKNRLTPLSRMKFVRGSFLGDLDKSSRGRALATFLRQENHLGEGVRRYPNQAYKEGWNNLKLACINFIRAGDAAYDAVRHSLQQDGEVPFLDAVKTCEQAKFNPSKFGDAYSAGILDAQLLIWGFMQTLEFLAENPEYASVSGYSDWLTVNDDPTVLEAEARKDRAADRKASLPAPGVEKRVQAAKSRSQRQS